MKVLFLAPDINIGIDMNGGAGTHMRASISQLKKRGFDVEVAVGGDLLNEKKISSSHISHSTHWRSFLRKIIPSEIKKTYRDYKILRQNKMVLAKVSEIVKTNNFDIIYERSGYGYDVGMVLSKRYKLPHILETDVIMLDLIRNETSFIFNKYIYRILERKKYHAADTIVVQSEYSIAYCKKYWGIRHNKVYNKDLGVNLINEKNEIKDVRELYDIKNKFVVGFVGYFMPYQNIHLLLEAAKKMLKNQDVIFLFVGGGKLLNSFKQFAKNNLLDNTIFTGIVDKNDVASYYKAIDLAVIPDCAHHMYPVKYLEYAQNNLPIVMPRYAVFKEFYENESVYEKMSFRPKDSFSLVQTLNKLLKEKSNLSNYSSFTSHYVKENKTWDKSGEKLQNILSKTYTL